MGLIGDLIYGTRTRVLIPFAYDFGEKVQLIHLFVAFSYRSVPQPCSYRCVSFTSAFEGLTILGVGPDVYASTVSEI